MGKKLTLKKIRKFCIERSCDNCPLSKIVTSFDCIFELAPSLWDIDEIEQLVKETKEKEAK